MHDLADYHTAVDRGLVLLVRIILHNTRYMDRHVHPVSSCQAAN